MSCHKCIHHLFSRKYFYRGLWNEKESKELSVKLDDLKAEEDILKSEVNKLKDPVYVAKYAREKFFYSGANEYIIRMK